MNGSPPLQLNFESPQHRSYYENEKVAAMNVNALLTNDGPARNQLFYPPASTPHTNGTAVTPKSLSPNSGIKAVSFRLRDSINGPKTFHIRPHDTTDSIIDTVKHLLGVSRHYELGVSLEDEEGLSFIPSYDNFSDGMTVYVRIEENLPQEFARRHSYNLRQSHGPNGVLSNGGPYDYPASRSASPNGRGRRSASVSRQGRSRSLKRSSLHIDEDNHYRENYHTEGQWYSLPHQQFLPDDCEEPRTKAGSVASADISVENILEGSRRKRPKFSSDELPLFPPPALPRQNGSVSSLSPTRQPAQIATPYRHYSYSHYTPPSLAGDHPYVHGNGFPLQQGVQATVPTPAPTVTSCISDEDVAIQLMRLGNANSASASASTSGDNRSAFLSDGGEYGEEDEGRSDTTELPDPLPDSAANRYGSLPDSPILYPAAQKKFKSLDEILPSFDTTEPSDDENQPPEDPNEDVGDDEADESYVLQEDENDGDYDDDLDDVPLKMRRDKKFSVPAPKPKHNLSKGMAKAIKRQNPSHSKSTPNGKAHHDIHHYPISPASPPASRKPSVSSINSNKSRPHTTVVYPHPHNFGTPSSQDLLISHLPLDDGVTEEPQRPRCQRCRKSKKGCDRQRPCQRCKDAGIPADQCISEDEAGTRRGRQAAAAAKRASLQNGAIKSANPGLVKIKKKKPKV